ncbi:MAG TPA: hypothetical protein VJN18_30540 [Polyangiaceae bacterium]|nr:hypothetical protein [Polyangiaceae bacterium]
MKSRKSRTPLEKSLVGPAGEHFVMYQVHARGMLAALTPRNLAYADVMTVAPDGSASALVQVKARTYGRDGGWHMRDKHETVVFERLFYCFVDFESQPPATYIVPSKVVAAALRESHQVWLSSPPKRGDEPHKDNPMRRILPRYDFSVTCAPDGWLDQWKERWELLA